MEQAASGLGRPKEATITNPVSPKLTIRTAQHSDYDSLCELFEEVDLLHRQARPDLFFAPTGASREIPYVRGLIEGRQSTILVASHEGDGTLLGLATLIVRDVPVGLVTRARRFLEIDNLAVRSTARRQGIGRALIGHAIAWARVRHIKDLELGVHTFNAAAIAFYEALGFHTQRQRMAIDARQEQP